MRLTLYTDYSLRLLIYAALKPDDLVNVSDVAKAYGISRNHLTKVVHQLGLAGYLETVRGKGGGLRLAKAPASIRVGDVVRQTEPDMALATCFRPIDGPCVILRSCLLRTALHEAREAFLHALDGYTLADLTTPAPDLLTLLGIAVSTGGAKRAGSKPASDAIPAVRPGGAERALPGGRIVDRPSNRS
ncbi:MAG: Rrf2 family transcriptional regulator [Lautropia sp.]|nr:Rrf2 family transcriptional regulator [Lautropia sp.]